MKTVKYLIIIILITYGCGFKIMKKSELHNFFIESVEITGNKKIGFNLKNKLLSKTGNKLKNKVNLIIDIKKKKSIKEKDSSNAISKYLITLNLTVRVEGDKKSKTFSLSEQKDFNSTSQYSQSIINENQTIKLITNLMVEKILREISFINFNDL
tara:strand:+ start:779 stop:1243 length:465 start_codon:yes stop_codon:yes gene_type:complete